MDTNQYIILMDDIAAAGVDKYTSDSTTEIYSHENVIVLGNQALVIQDTLQYAEFDAFFSDVQGMSKVPVVDSVVAYYCPFTSEIYLLVMRNSLHIPIMKHNLIPTFILRLAWLTVSKVPKIHCSEPTVEDHSIYDDVTKIQIPFKLNGILSYFPTQDLTLE